MYKLLPSTVDLDGSTQEPSCILKTDTGEFIRIADDNPHYNAYLKWLDEGNQPLPAD